MLVYERIDDTPVQLIQDLFPQAPAPRPNPTPILQPVSGASKPSNNLAESHTAARPNSLSDSTDLLTLEAHVREFDPGGFSDLIRPASVAIPLFSEIDDLSDSGNDLPDSGNDLPDSANQPYQFTFSTSKKNMNRRGEQTAKLRAQRDERVLESIEFLAEIGRAACVSDDRRQEITQTSPPNTLLQSVIEHERIRTSRASATPESLTALTRSSAVADALRAYAKSPWTFNPADHPDAFVRVNEEDLHSSSVVQQYYFRTYGYSVAQLLEHIAISSGEFRADADRFAVLVRRLADLEKMLRVYLNYVGTTYASNPAERHSHDKAAADMTYTRLTNWMKLFPADAVEIWKLYPLDQPLEGPSDWSPMQRHRRNSVAVDIEELLIDLGGGYLLNSAFGGTGSFKFSPTRMSPEERATESLVLLFFVA